mmetsp:Transcript_17950/g.45263  ORF Transcript_17950/g.45263 Transcript_17950/m.45263 type:complete len:362 (+) Transcript_17950:495-1580(+)
MPSVLPRLSQTLASSCHLPGAPPAAPRHSRLQDGPPLHHSHGGAPGATMDFDLQQCPCRPGARPLHPLPGSCSHHARTFHHAAVFDFPRHYHHGGRGARRKVRRGWGHPRRPVGVPPLLDGACHRLCGEKGSRQVWAPGAARLSPNPLSGCFRPRHGDLALPLSLDTKNYTCGTRAPIPPPRDGAQICDVNLGCGSLPPLSLKTGKTEALPSGLDGTRLKRVRLEGEPTDCIATGEAARSGEAVRSGEASRDASLLLCVDMLRMPREMASASRVRLSCTPCLTHSESLETVSFGASAIQGCSRACLDDGRVSWALSSTNSANDRKLTSVSGGSDLAAESVFVTVCRRSQNSNFLSPSRRFR